MILVLATCVCVVVVVVVVVVSHIQRIGCQPEKNYFTRCVSVCLFITSRKQIGIQPCTMDANSSMFPLSIGQT